ncbi:uncharacterized protein LOC111280033 [Durio zibethinus]|uniref:Uncharacterized protein LOC111280033 n=1 Tax=Durio zibethinus TaxID=66656 RepID=A0A6P5X3Z8_DURZI|nr:uncharacterized protein LOC111280033 [Durio zibethinus]
MDTVHNDVKDVKGHKNKTLGTIDALKVEDHTEGEDYSESYSLLPPKKAVMSRKPEKTRRKVQWNDKNGNKLAEVLEYQPSDVSDSDVEDSDSCICIIM